MLTIKKGKCPTCGEQVNLCDLLAHEDFAGRIFCDVMCMEPHVPVRVRDESFALMKGEKWARS